MYKLWMLSVDEEISCLKTEDSKSFGNIAAYDLTVYDGSIHVALSDYFPKENDLEQITSIHGRARCWRYDADSGQWTLTYEQISSLKYLEKDVLPSPACNFFISQHAESVDAHLFAVFFTGSDSSTLVLEANKWVELLSPRISGEQKLDLHSIYKIDQKFYGTGTFQTISGQDPAGFQIFAAANINASEWESLSYPGFGLPGNTRITSVVSFHDYLYVGISNPVRGCQIWKIQFKNVFTKHWNLVLDQGAYRYSLNQDVLASVVWQDKLYLMLGTSNCSQHSLNPETLPSPELICIYGDGSWDLVCGTPRFSPHGLKVPLSALGPGFDEPVGACFQFMKVHNSVLYVGLIFKDQFQLWYTKDGDVWLFQAIEELSEQDNLEVSAAFSSAAGLVLISHFPKERTVSELSISASKTAEFNSLPAYSGRQPKAKRTSSGVITNLSSSTDSLLKYSHQNYLWFTEDNILHGLFNIEQEQGAGLALCSSVDTGRKWQLISYLSGSDDSSTADSCLHQEHLLVAYSVGINQIRFARFRYDSEHCSWRFIQSSVVFEQEGIKCSVPSLVVDSNNALWCTFIRQTSETAKFDIKVVYSNDSGLTWFDPTLTLGLTNASTAKASRLVILSDRVGVFYTSQYMIPDQGVVRTRNWAYRMNSWAIEEPWKTQVLFQHEHVDELREDKIGSHFSVASDCLDNIHVAFQDSGQLIYLKYDGDSQRWQEPVALTDDCRVSFVKVSVSNQHGKVFVVCNVRSFAKVFESPLNSVNFQSKQLLLHPTGEGLYFSSPRLAAPSVVDLSLPVFQQFKSDSQWGAIAFHVEL